MLEQLKRNINHEQASIRESVVTFQFNLYYQCLSLVHEAAKQILIQILLPYLSSAWYDLAMLKWSTKMTDDIGNLKKNSCGRYVEKKHYDNSDERWKFSKTVHNCYLWWKKND